MMARLRVILHIPEPRQQDAGSLVHVAVLDTSQADALHHSIAEATATIPPGSDRVELDIDLPDDALAERHRYSLWGHVAHEGTSQMRPGDLIITQNIPVTPDNIRDGASALDATLTRI